MNYKLQEAIEISGIDIKNIDMSLLVGMFYIVNKWAKFEEKNHTNDTKNICDFFRSEGLSLIKKIEIECNEYSDDEIFLNISKQSNGLWKGDLFVGNKKFGECNDCASPNEVKKRAKDSGIIFSKTKIEEDGESTQSM